MFASLLLTAAIITIPPPAEAAAIKPELAVITGIGNPDWARLGLQGRYGALGGTLAAGTIGIGYGLTGAGRWFFPAPAQGAFAEAGLTLALSRAISVETPGEIFPLGFVAVGWQFRAGPWLAEVALGPPPSLLAPIAMPALITLNAIDIPRLELGVGYAF